MVIQSGPMQPSLTFSQNDLLNNYSTRLKAGIGHWYNVCGWLYATSSHVQIPVTTTGVKMWTTPSHCT